MTRPSTKSRFLTHLAVLLAVGVVVHVVLVERKVRNNVAQVEIGQSISQVETSLGQPDTVSVAKLSIRSKRKPDKVRRQKLYVYSFPYLWDYVLPYPLRRTRSARVVFSEDGIVEEVSTRRYLSRMWYVRKSSER